MTKPNILLIMTDEERYPPPYEVDAVTSFRANHLAARESIRASGLEFHRHYAGSTACTPSGQRCSPGSTRRSTGCKSTDGTAKQASDPAMGWLDPNSVPTLGDWFRAGGYKTHYRGKWHVSHADLLIPGDPRGAEGLRRCGQPDPRGGRGVPEGGPARPVRVLGVDRPRAARRGEVRLRHGPRRCLRRAGRRAVRRARRAHGPRDRGWRWRRSSTRTTSRSRASAGSSSSASGHRTTRCPIPEAPSQGDSFAGRPPCQEQFKAVLAEDDLRGGDRPRLPPALLLPAQGRRRVHRADPGGPEASGMYDETIVVFTSDHGELLGAHGGLVQKWSTPSTRPPGAARSSRARASPRPRRVLRADEPRRPDPTLLGPGRHRRRAGGRRRGRPPRRGAPLPGRDLSGVVSGETARRPWRRRSTS